MAHEEEKHGGHAPGRGVTRPGVQSTSHAGQEASGPEARRRRTEEEHHAKTLWAYWSIVMLGAWTVLAPVTFGYGTAVAEPSGGRELWLSDEARVLFAQWNDVACGLLLAFFGWRSLRPHRPLSMWAACGVGVWMSVAPVLFWSPSAAAYANDTLVGMLVIALTILIPGMPHMSMFMKHGGSVPPGWSYNPSSWPQRAVMIALGFAGFVTSRYLAAYQMGFVDRVWDPFFGAGSARVLDSSMSHMWPVSDAALGALAYTFEFLMGFMGSPARWRTMPWMVTFYGILVIPLGLVHILLVISQPLIVGSWCTFCLLAAAIMLPMLPLEGDEVIAMGQHLLRAKRRGESAWRVFWKGGDASDAGEDRRTPELSDLPEEPRVVGRASVWGMSAPWTLVATAALGVLAMFVPAMLGMETRAPGASAYHLCGALIVTCSVIAMGEVFRAVRWLDVGLGIAIAIAPWALGAGLAAGVIGIAIGALVIGLSVPRGKKKERYAGWDRAVV